MDKIYKESNIEKEISKKGGKVYAFFANVRGFQGLKAAFNIVSREKLWTIIKSKGIRLDKEEGRDL